MLSCEHKNIHPGSWEENAGNLHIQLHTGNPSIKLGCEHWESIKLHTGNSLIKLHTRNQAVNTGNSLIKLHTRIR